jgi:methyl-accepting chemotaxis protein
VSGKATLATRLAGGAALIALVPLIALTATSTVLAEDAIRKQLDVALIARAQNFAGLVQSSILEPLSRDNALRGWVSDPQIAGAFAGPKGRDGCNRFLATATRGRVLVGAQLLDATGRPLCASAPELAVPAQAGAPWFRAALEGTLASEGIVPGQRGPALTLALEVKAGDGSGGVLRAWYDWRAIAQLIEAPISQARLTDDEVQLQISAGDQVLYDSSGKDALLLTPGSGTRGRGESGELLIAWARNDTGATDPGGGFVYVCRVLRPVAFASLRKLVRTIALVAVVAAMLAALAAWLVSQRMVRPLDALGAVVERIVRDGDLTQEIEVSRHDEIGRLAALFTQLVTKLREIPRSLRESVQALSEEVARLEGAARDQNERVARQAAALQEAHVTAQQIRQTSLVAAEKANAVLGAAQRADDVGRAGQDAVSQSLSELEQILGHVDAISRTVSELGESTSRIAGIAGVVKDLADQSNMLALNAAIEAVRSGEHGRGFAVVAREIRSLADQSIKATQRVQESLDGIRTNAARALAITEEGSRGINANLARMRNSGDSLRELGSISRDNARAVREIAAAVGQQNSGIDQVFSAVRDLSSSMSDLVQLIEQSADSVREVGSVSARIDGIVNRFRV